MYLVFNNLIRSHSSSHIHGTDLPNMTQQALLMLAGQLVAQVGALELRISLCRYHTLLTLEAWEDTEATFLAVSSTPQRSSQWSVASTKLHKNLLRTDRVHSSALIRACKKALTQRVPVHMVLSAWATVLAHRADQILLVGNGTP